MKKRIINLFAISLLIFLINTSLLTMDDNRCLFVNGTNRTFFLLDPLGVESPIKVKPRENIIINKNHHQSPIFPGVYLFIVHTFDEKTNTFIIENVFVSEVNVDLTNNLNIENEFLIRFSNENRVVISTKKNDEIKPSSAICNKVGVLISAIMLYFTISCFLK